MRCLLQRVTSASVTVDGQTIGACGTGLLVLACAMQDDTTANIEAMARKLVNLRIFPDDAGKTNLSLLDVRGAALIVSQFTLAADTARGNRPGFSAAAPPEMGEQLYRDFCKAVASYGIPVGTGEFGADMQVSLVNDGPMTIWLEK
ncbi:MAG: D-tyrosyl-tRNA(Tyr) deacylase [Rhodobacteraceae bacterium]|nr:D-tyrosyl-tRNA(Tyr) deacylase [Paracoccaceae bacterium]